MEHSTALVTCATSGLGHAPASVQSALAEPAKRTQPADFLLLNAGMVLGKKRVITMAGVDASQAPLIGIIN